MKRGWLLAGFVVAWFLANSFGPSEGVQAQKKGEGETAAVQWIWFNEGDPATSAPAETRYFRKVFTIDRPVQKVVDEGTLDITADNAFTVWINGVEAGKGDNWQKVYRFDVTKLLIHGKNVIAVQARNTEGPAGLML